MRLLLHLFRVSLVFRVKMRKTTQMAANETELSRRERQVMDVLYQRNRATAQEVLEALPDRPQYSAVRSLLAVLEEKGVPSAVCLSLKTNRD